MLQKQYSNTVYFTCALSRARSYPIAAMDSCLALFPELETTRLRLWTAVLSVFRVFKHANKAVGNCLLSGRLMVRPMGDSGFYGQDWVLKCLSFVLEESFKRIKLGFNLHWVCFFLEVSKGFYG